MIPVRSDQSSAYRDRLASLRKLSLIVTVVNVSGGKCSSPVRKDYGLGMLRLTWL